MKQQNMTVGWVLTALSTQLGYIMHIIRKVF